LKPGAGLIFTSSFSLWTLQHMMPKPHSTKLYLNPIKDRASAGKTDFKKLGAMTDAEIRARRGDDPHFPEIDWAEADVQLVEPVVKKPVSIRLDSDVIDFFKDAGKGYQTRINQILRSYMEHQQKTG
tara:strand:+ start:22308 stop:22688 length:381 start_codon:yes stop_codon:yes gene_type:complete